MNSLLSIIIVVLAFFNGVAAFSAVSNTNNVYISPVAQENFEKWRPYLAHCNEFSPARAGGWRHVESLAAHPKESFVDYIMTLDTNQETLNALVGLLQAQGKGYEACLVNGEWVSVLSQQGTKSPKFQKLVDKTETKNTATANFDVDKDQFYGQAKVLKYGDLRSTVKFDPVSDNFDTINDKIVLRRISCDIVGASWKWWKLPRIPLPLRAKGGYLDFVYLDNDMRITRGNRGGLFVHFRPEFLQSESEAIFTRNENVGGEGI